MDITLVKTSSYNPFVGITQIRLYGSKRQYAYSQPACASSPFAKVYYTLFPQKVNNFYKKYWRSITSATPGIPSIPAKAAVMGVITVLIPAKPPTRFIPASINPPRRLLKINQTKSFKGFLKIMQNAEMKIIPKRKITATGTLENKKSHPFVRVVLFT